LSHHIQHLSFGIDYPGQVNPLDGTEQHADKGDDVYSIAVFSCRKSSAFYSII